MYESGRGPRLFFHMGQKCDHIVFADRFDLENTLRIEGRRLPDFLRSPKSISLSSSASTRASSMSSQHWKRLASLQMVPFQGVYNEVSSMSSLSVESHEGKLIPPMRRSLVQAFSGCKCFTATKLEREKTRWGALFRVCATTESDVRTLRSR